MLISFIKRLLGKLYKYYSRIEYKQNKKMNSKYNLELKIAEVSIKYPKLRDQYDYFHKYFWNRAPEWLKIHRNFFSKNSRSFGEDSFYAMWYLLFQYVRPKSFLEIGVYRGATLSLARSLSNHLDLKCEIMGISPFINIGDSVSKYEDFDYLNDVLKFSALCGAPIYPKELCISLSNSPEGVKTITSHKWDIIYIDGNHDYEFVKSDFTLCQQYINPNGYIVLDDAALYTSYNPRSFSSKGHPGPSRVVQEALRNGFYIFIQVGHNIVLKKNR